MDERIKILYDELFRRLSLSVPQDVIDAVANKYKYNEFNFASLIIDIARLNMMHVISDLCDLKKSIGVEVPVAIAKSLKGNDYYLIIGYKDNCWEIYDGEGDAPTFVADSVFMKKMQSWCVLVDSLGISTVSDRGVFFNVIAFFKKNLYPVAFISIFLLLLASLPLGVNVLFGLVCLLGLVVSYNLMKLAAGGNDGSLFLKLCNNGEKSNNCSNVTKSKYGNVLGRVSLSELGAMFFLFNTFCLLTIPHVFDSTYVVGVNIVAAILSVVLFFVQKNLLKEFCPLCLLVSVCVFLLNFILFFGTNGLNYSYVYELIINFTVSIFVISLVSKYLVISNNLESSRSQLIGIVEDPGLFQKKLKKVIIEPTVGGRDILIKSGSGIELLTLYVSTTCEHCINFLSEMLFLLLISEAYSLKVRVVGDMPESLKFNWVADLIEKFVAENDIAKDAFSVNVDGCAQSTDGICNLLVREEVEVNTSVKPARHSKIRVPMLIKEGFVVDTMYNAELTKAHLVLQEYNG